MAEHYIWQEKNWPQYEYDRDKLVPLLLKISNLQGMLAGIMETLGLNEKAESTWLNISADIVKSSAIEGVELDLQGVRSSVARNLGLERQGLPASDYYTDGIVQITMDALKNYAVPLTAKRLYGWQAALFPSGYSSIYKINIGSWRTAAEPMMVISGPLGHEVIHYVAPPADCLEAEMDKFFDFVNNDNNHHPLIKAAIAHLWFVVIHPFDDGNGRIARAITDYLLAKADNSSQRYYSISAVICQNRDSYYRVLETASNGRLDITGWIEWFLGMLGISLDNAISTTRHILAKSRFWSEYGQLPLNERQIKVLNKLWDGFEGKLTNGKWVKIAHCSAVTAFRDIQQLVEWGILAVSESGGRSTSYSLSFFDVTDDK